MVATTVQRASAPLLVAVPCAAAGVAVVVAAGSDTAIFVAAVGALVLCLAGTHVLAHRATGDHLSPLSLAAVFYAVAFAAGSVFVWVAPGVDVVSASDRVDLVAALGLVTASWALFAAGYALDPFGIVKTVVSPPNRIAAGAGLAAVLLPLLGIGWAARLASLASDRYFHLSSVTPVRTGATWFLDATSGLPLLALAFLAVHALSSGSPRRHRAWLLVLTLVELGWSIPTGSRSRIVDVLLVLLVVRYYVSGKLPSLRIAVVGALVMVFVVFPFGATYRALDFRASVSVALFSATSETARGGIDRTLASGTEAVARLSDISAVARLVDQGRDRIELAPGESFLWAIQGVVPRALYPDKPDPGRFGNDFGRAYGFIDASNYRTAIAVTQPGEVYLNGGWLGILIGMPLLGGLYRLVSDYLRARSSDPGVLALYATAATGLMLGLETIVALGFVGVVKTTVLYGLALALTARLARAGRTPTAGRVD